MSERDPGALGGPDRRYWRRRANRHVRKQRRARALSRISLVVGLNLIVLSVLGYSGYRAWRHVYGCGEFSIDTIRIEGTERCEPERIHGALADLLGRNLLALDLDEVAARVEREPWIESCAVRRELPHTLRVAVRERRPRARVRVGGETLLVDRAGTLLTPLGPSGDGLPLLVGLDRLQDGELRHALQRGVLALERLGAVLGEWTSSVVQVDLSRVDRLEVITVPNGPRLLLDPERVERNVRDYLALKPQIDRRIGPVEYIDLRWSDRISVMPRIEEASDL